MREGVCLYISQSHDEYNSNNRTVIVLIFIGKLGTCSVLKDTNVGLYMGLPVGLLGAGSTKNIM